jgi:hypothetical protein
VSMPDEAPSTLVAALAGHDAGLCIIRSAIDGTKKPLGSWKQYQTQRPTRDEVAAWFADGHPGMGVVCGAVSGNLEMLELEGRFMAELATEFARRISAAGLDLLFKRLTNGYHTVSPSTGRHFLYRVEGSIEGNTKLARDPNNDTLIETRGEGGFVVLAPSHGAVHPTGKAWRVKAGTFGGIPTLTTEERDALFAVCRSFDEGPEVKPPPPLPVNKRTTFDRATGVAVTTSWMDAVVDHLNARGARAALEDHGWTFCYTDKHGRDLLRRPGKDQGVSGSINTNGRFHPFSTSVPFKVGGQPATTFDALDIIAAYEYGGDRQGAARAIAESTGILDTWRASQDAQRVLVPSGVDAETGEVAPSDNRNLPDEFWDARPCLQQIRQAAHNRARSADAVLLFTLGRVAAITHPTIMLPAIAGGRASLNFLGGIISSSGGGKSTAGTVARDLVPINLKTVVADVPPGSGEGLTELYFEFVEEEQPDGKKKKVKRQNKSGAFIYLDEGQALAEMGNRKGATLLPTLRSAWSGEVIGQSNATVETHRVLKAHSYRMAILVGFQLEYAAGLIADAAGGTPQRFVFATATDPAVPDDPPAWPGPLEVAVRPIMAEGQEIEFDADVALDIRRRSIMQVRGELAPDPLDTHSDLVRMKVAALLGVIDGRLEVSGEDWWLAGLVMKTSAAVRGWVIETARRAAADGEVAFAMKLANRATIAETTAENRALHDGARAMARKVHRMEGEMVPRRVLLGAAAGRHKKLASVDEMILLAEDKGWITPTPDGWKPGESRPT